MSKLPSTLRVVIFAAGVVVGLGAPARSALAGSGASVEESNLVNERADLRHRLDALNTEIAVLKQSQRGVADDYRLRARLADAEALARRLIEIEARLGVRGPAGTAAPVPVASPSDGPTELDAKADILSDRSRWVLGEADALAARIAEIESRQNLRRRAADLDRDPFAPLEASKRRMATVAVNSVAAGSASMPASGSGGPATTTTGASNTASRGVGSPTGGPTLTVAGSGPGSATPTSSPVSPAAQPAVSVELRDLLDPATVADIRRLEMGKTPAGSLAALERAVAALRARASALDAEARSMRAAARGPR
jgi:hypothetical protein